MARGCVLLLDPSKIIEPKNPARCIGTATCRLPWPQIVVVGRLQQLEDDVLNVLADIASFGERRRIGDGERNVENSRQRLRQQCLAACFGAGCTLGRATNKDKCDLDHCVGRRFYDCYQLGAATIFIFRGTDEKARVDSRTYSHLKEARTQKKASGRNCAKIEKDRGGDATKGF